MTARYSSTARNLLEVSQRAGTGGGAADTDEADAEAAAALAQAQVSVTLQSAPRQRLRLVCPGRRRAGSRLRLTDRKHRRDKQTNQDRNGRLAGPRRRRVAWQPLPLALAIRDEICRCNDDACFWPQALTSKMR